MKKDNILTWFYKHPRIKNYDPTLVTSQIISELPKERKTMHQKAIIVTSNPEDPNLRELNQLLENNWSVVNTCSLSSSVINNKHEPGTYSIETLFYPSCLVIIETR